MHGMEVNVSVPESSSNGDRDPDMVQCNEDEKPLENSGSTQAIRIPIVGFEVMDERARFTVFKLRIENEKLGDSWLVFRRYTDFVRLHAKLKEEFPGLNLPLPPKRWLRDNFETAFLEDRMKGLQAFVDFILLVQPSITDSPTVRDFFCLDEPPVYPESMEETRSMFGTVENSVVHLRSQLSDKLMEIELLKAELALVTNQRDLALKTTKSCRNCSHKLSFITPPESVVSTNGLSTSSLAENPSASITMPSIRSASCSDHSTSSSSLTSQSQEKSLTNSPKVCLFKDAAKANGEVPDIMNETSGKGKTVYVGENNFAHHQNQTSQE